MAVATATLLRPLRSSKARSKTLLSVFPLISSSVSGFTVVTPKPLSIPNGFTRNRPIMTATTFEEDPYLYLEEVESPESLAFAKEANEKCLAALGDPSETETYKRVLAALTSDERIPHVSMMGYEEGEMLLYNFWRDAKVSIHTEEAVVF
jgi:prolyl oligopeptidase